MRAIKIVAWWILLGVVLVACSDDKPSAAECETITDRDACYQADGCLFTGAIRADFDEDGSCTFDESEWTSICIVDTGISMSSEAVYARNSAADSDIRYFPSDYGELEGWTKRSISECEFINTEAERQEEVQTCRRRALDDCISPVDDCIPARAREYDFGSDCWGELEPVLCLHESEDLDGVSYFLNSENDCLQVAGFLPDGWGFEQADELECPTNPEVCAR